MGILSAATEIYSGYPFQHWRSDHRMGHGPTFPTVSRWLSGNFMDHLTFIRLYIGWALYDALGLMESVLVQNQYSPKSLIISLAPNAQLHWGTKPHSFL